MPKLEADFKIRVSDLSRNNRLKESTIFELLQEVACEHAKNMGVGYDDLIVRKLAWALSKIDLHIYAYPKAREEIRIETWAALRTKIASERDFIAYDSQGNVIFEAQSLWVLFDIEKRRCERLSVLKDWQELKDKRANADIHKKLEKVSQGTYIKEYRPRKNDIDLNNHLNNAIYTALAIDSLPLDFYQSHLARNISISFLAEVKEEDIIEAKCDICENKSLHSIYKKDSNTEFARLNIQWQEI